jgi:hypothetical protein
MLSLPWGCYSCNNEEIYFADVEWDRLHRRS